MAQEQLNISMDSVIDDGAFERAFDAAKQELEDTESITQSLAAESSSGPQEIIDYRIGSDRILDEVQQRPEALSKDREADELARTAGQILDNVKHDNSTKFKDSNFLHLMRQFRDKEVKVEGDKIIEVIT